MTEIKFLRSFVSAHGSHHAGRSLEIPDELAEKWIASGHAEAIKAEKKPKKKVEEIETK